jgi:hypothetical protein
VSEDDEPLSEEEELARIDAMGARLEANPDDPEVLAVAVAEARKSPVLVPMIDALMRLKPLVILRDRYRAEGDAEGLAEIEAEIAETRKALYPPPADDG